MKTSPKHHKVTFYMDGHRQETIFRIQWTSINPNHSRKGISAGHPSDALIKQKDKDHLGMETHKENKWKTHRHQTFEIDAKGEA